MLIHRNILPIFFLIVAPVLSLWSMDALGFLDEPFEPVCQQVEMSSYMNDDSWLFEDIYDENNFEDPFYRDDAQEEALLANNQVQDQPLEAASTEIMAPEEAAPQEEPAYLAQAEDMLGEEDLVFFDEDMDMEETANMNGEMAMGEGMSTDEEAFMSIDEEMAMDSMMAPEEMEMVELAEAPKPTAPVVQVAEPAAPIETFSIDFPEEEIRNIIRNVADLYGLNVVIPDTLIGMTSITLSNVTWQQVYRAVLEPVGFTYTMDGNIIKIVSSEELQAEQMETEIFPLRFAVAAEAAASLANMLDTKMGASVNADARTNSLIVTERPSRMNRLEEIIKRLDREETQIMIEAKFVEVSNTNNKDLGVDWSSLSSYALSLGEKVDSGAITGPFNRAFSKIEGQDLPAEGDTASKRTDTIVFGGSKFDLLLKALQKKVDARLIANPTVVTMNNTPAKIAIADEEPIPKFTYNSETGTNEIDGFDYKEIGIILNVTPKAKQDLITLDIKPEISTSDRNKTFKASGTGSDFTLPVISNRSTQSVVTIKSGYTIAIGGLIKRESTKTKSYIPFIGQLPLVGRAFSSDSNGGTDTNVILFVTATQIGFDGSMPDPINEPVRNFKPRQAYEMGLSYSEMNVENLTPEMYEKMRRIQDIRDDAFTKEYQARLDKELNLQDDNGGPQKSNRRRRVGRIR